MYTYEEIVVVVFFVGGGGLHVRPYLLAQKV